MKWPLFVPLLAIILPGLLAFPYGANDEGDLLEYEKRVPFMLPQLSFLNRGRNQDEERPEEMMRRRRRNPFLRPVELSEDQDGDDYEYERKRRGIYLYPSLDSYSWWDKRAKESMSAKRGTPFYFPYSFFKFPRNNHRG